MKTDYQDYGQRVYKNTAALDPLKLSGTRLAISINQGCL